jgi:hypothetical protein
MEGTRWKGKEKGAGDDEDTKLFPIEIGFTSSYDYSYQSKGLTLILEATYFFSASTRTKLLHFQTSLAKAKNTQLRLLTFTCYFPL